MEFLENFGYLGLFVASFLSATVLPVASEGFLALMVYKGFNPVITVLSATAGNVLGGLTTYFLGYLARWDLIEKYFGVPMEKVANYKPRMDRHGAMLAVFSIFPVIGDVLVVGLGFFKVPLIRVFVWMLMAKAARYIIITLLVLKGWDLK